MLDDLGDYVFTSSGKQGCEVHPYHATRGHDQQPFVKSNIDVTCLDLNEPDFAITPDMIPSVEFL